MFNSTKELEEKVEYLEKKVQVLINKNIEVTEYLKSEEFIDRVIERINRKQLKSK